MIEYFNLADRHKNFDIKVMERLEKQGRAEIEALSTAEARQVYNWNRQVAGCYQRSRAFSRLKISKNSIVYGKIEPEHFVEDLVARWFLSRFPMFTIMVESSRGTFVVSKEEGLTIYKESIDRLLPEFEKILPENDILSDLGSFKEDDFWENYYSSQFINERKNRRYFLHNIPRKFHSWEGLSLEKRRFDKNRMLSEFD